MAVKYYTEDCRFNYPGKRATSAWVRSAIAEEGLETGEISVIFCSDDYLLQMNIEHLGHDYYTDIITFDYREGGVVSGDLFISIDTVRSNAAKYGDIPFLDELRRVIIHGVMHICGYGDKTLPEEKIMRQKENHYLTKFEKHQK